MDKIKEFFEKKLVILIEGIIIALAGTGLFVGGLENVPELIQKIGTGVGGVLAAVEALITIIQGLTKKTEK